MSCSKFERSSRFRDENVERLIKTIERAVFSGDALMQEVKRLKQKFQVWDDYLAQVCKEVTALADEIDRHHKRASIVKLAGSVAGAAAGPAAVGAGGVLAAGIVLSPLGGVALPIAGAAAAALGGVAGAGAVVAGGAAIADEAIKLFKKKKAQELLDSEKELRGHITDCMQELQRASAEFEESINLIIRMSTSQFDYSNSLKAIEETKSILHSLMDWISDEGDKKKVGELCKTLLDMVSKVADVESLISFFSSPVSIGSIGVVVAVATAPLHFINLVVASIDIHQGSKTELARRLREHVDKFQKDRTEIREAADSYFKINE